jgi:hypothetical protein
LKTQSVKQPSQDRINEDKGELQRLKAENTMIANKFKVLKAEK